MVCRKIWDDVLYGFLLRWVIGDRVSGDSDEIRRGLLARVIRLQRRPPTSCTNAWSEPLSGRAVAEDPDGR